METRVSRLYYYRDAHRVAQIINRNVQACNRTAVDLKRREAEESRKRADDATDLRRQREREAIEKAQDMRRVERELNELPAELTKAANREAELADLLKREKAARISREERRTTLTTQLKEANQAVVEKNQARTTLGDSVAKKEAEVNDLMHRIDNPNPTDPADKEERRRRYQDAAESLAQLKLRLDAATTAEGEAKQVRDGKSTELTKLQAEITDASEDEKRAERELQLVKTKRDQLLNRQKELNQQLPDLRRAENQTREARDQAQAKEDRSREDQFRKEVAAAHEDPDTYVPADLESCDPVSRVSISVIGEGLIHMRGPIRGINKIRTMIHQIDSPVGQVKVGIFTVQVNGEHGDRMEKVAQRIEGHIDISRFLTAQSLQMLRRAVQETAARVAEQAEASYPNLHCQADRDRKYMYSFFGRDFVDELYEMDSELLRSGNKVLALHSMDTVSLSKAMFLLAVAKNDVRQEILARFMELIDCEIPQAEYDFRKASGLLPCRLNSYREVQKNVWEKYRFRSIRGFFNAEVAGPDTMTPMQREFIRLAQIFKSQMVAELEFEQRVNERGLIQDRAREDRAREDVYRQLHQEALDDVQKNLKGYIDVRTQLQPILAHLRTKIASLRYDENVLRSVQSDVKAISNLVTAANAQLKMPPSDRVKKFSIQGTSVDVEFGEREWTLGPKAKEMFGSIALKSRQRLEELKASDAGLGTESLQTAAAAAEQLKDIEEGDPGAAVELLDKLSALHTKATNRVRAWEQLQAAFDAFASLALDPLKTVVELNAKYKDLQQVMESGLSAEERESLRASLQDAYRQAVSLHQLATEQQKSLALAESTRQDLDHKKLLEHQIDEQEDKYIELLEGTRAHIATIDNYLKRLAIAIEDDCKVQFYDPAFAGVRKAAWEYDVNLGQVERTTILTNNRAFAKVSPQATMEFDLPKRDILIQEAMKGAKAMVEDYGALIQDPSFLAATKMLSGSPVAGKTGGASSVGASNLPAVKDVLPGLPSESDEQILNQSSGQERELGSALEALIPDPAIYKFETGTGFEIRPVIQPDGDSIVYDFNYMYTTNVREPVRADEKHLGRVKRHFIDTQVQTSSFELREISRYQVALKASRTGRGVPLLEDIPGVGVLFRPQPSAESSLQQNIILGQSTVYPTLFDLMGLRWAPYIVDTEGAALRDAEHVVRGRRQIINNFVSEYASKRVDGFLGIKKDGEYNHLSRPDLYHTQPLPSRHHPSGYSDPNVTDPLGQDFKRQDPRPAEMQHEPAYDKYGRPICCDPPHSAHGNPNASHERLAPGTIILREQGSPPESAPTSRGPRFPDKAGAKNETRGRAGGVDQAEYSIRVRGQDEPASERTGRKTATAKEQEAAPREPSRLKKLLGRLPYPGKSSE